MTKQSNMYGMIHDASVVNSIDNFLVSALKYLNEAGPFVQYVGLVEIESLINQTLNKVRDETEKVTNLLEAEIEGN